MILSYGLNWICRPLCQHTLTAKESAGMIRANFLDGAYEQTA